MKKTILLIPLIVSLRIFGQSPANDPHWEETESWDFKTMSWNDFTNDWYIAPCVRALDHENGAVEPQYYSPSNVSLNSNGVQLTAKQEIKYDKLICYESNTFKLSDNVNNL